MFPHAEVQIASGVELTTARRSLRVFELSSWTFKVAQVLQHRESRWIQIRRTPDQGGELRRDGIENFATGGSSRHSLSICRKTRNRRFPAGRQFAAEHPIEFFSLRGKFRSVVRVFFLPSGFRLFAFANGFA